MITLYMYGFHAVQIDGISMLCFNSCTSWADHIIWVVCNCICVLRTGEVRVTIFVVVLQCKLIVCGMMMVNEREKVQLVPAHSLLLSISTKGTARLYFYISG